MNHCKGGDTKRTRGTEIPKDVLFEILKRLPIKSLSRLRWVSTSWLSVISDPEFIRSLYTDRSNVALFYFHQLGRPCKFLVYDQDHSKMVAKAAVRVPNHLSTAKYVTSQSVHGLICFCLRSGYGGLTILNPSTRECISVAFPRVTEMSRPGRHHMYWYHCFGFDPVAEKHKVLCAIRACNMKSRHPKRAIELMVFTVGSADNWRRIGISDVYHLKSDLHGEVCINGVIYFVSSYYGSTGAYYLVSFDLMKSESLQFVKLSFPGNILSCKLIEFNGSVALADKHLDYTNRRVKIWVLEDFDKQVWDWKRSCVVPDLFPWTTCMRGLYFACALRRGELLVFMPYGNEARPELCLFFFDMVSNRIWAREFPVPTSYTTVICCDHIESLFRLS